MENQFERYFQILEEIDDGSVEVNDWEAGFIENLLAKRPKNLSPKQIEVIEKMEEKYL